jgi:hypothetical protein
MVDDFKFYFTTILPDLIRTGSSHTVDLSSLNWKSWTKNDLTSLATNKYAVDLFESLIIFKNGAVEKKDGKYTVDAIGAQNVLADLAPTICSKNTGDDLEPWQRFFDLIEIVQRETAGKRPSATPQPKYTPAAAQNTPASTQKTQSADLPKITEATTDAMKKAFFKKLDDAFLAGEFMISVTTKDGSVTGLASKWWSEGVFNELVKCKGPKSAACLDYLIALSYESRKIDCGPKCEAAKQALATLATSLGDDTKENINRVIMDMALKTKQQRDAYRAGKKTGMVHPSYEGMPESLPLNIGLNRMDDPAFNQQAALDLFTKNAVVMNTEHSFISPDPKAAALEAVKALKGNIRSA